MRCQKHPRGPCTSYKVCMQEECVDVQDRLHQKLALYSWLSGPRLQTNLICAYGYEPRERCAGRFYLVPPDG